MHAKIHISGNRWSPCLPLGVDDDHRFVTLTSNTLERPQLDISLHDGVSKLAANQSLGVENLKIAEGVAELREKNTTTDMRPPSNTPMGSRTHSLMIILESWVWRPYKIKHLTQNG